MTTIELRLLFLAGLILMAVVMALAAGAALTLARWIGAARPRPTAFGRRLRAPVAQGRAGDSA